MPGGPLPVVPPPPPADGKPGWYRGGEWPHYQFFHWDGSGWTETMNPPDSSAIPAEGWMLIKEEKEEWGSGIGSSGTTTIETRAWRDPNTGLVWTQRGGSWMSVHRPSPGWQQLALPDPPPDPIAPPTGRGLSAFTQWLATIFGWSTAWIWVIFAILIVVLILAATLPGESELQGTVLTTQTTPTAATTSLSTTIGLPPTSASAAAATEPQGPIVDGTCVETQYRGRVLSAQVDGLPLSYTDIEAQLTATLSADCTAGFHIFWVGQTSSVPGGRPLCYAVLGGGGGRVDADGVFFGGHTVNAGSFDTPRGADGETFLDCAAVVAQGNVGQYLGQRGGDAAGTITAAGFELTDFRTDPEKGPPHLALHIGFEVDSG